MPQTIKGTGSAIEQSPERIWDRTTGWVTVRVWHGSKAAIEGLIPVLQASFDNVELRTGDGVLWEARARTNTAEDGSDEQPTETWELLGSGQSEPVTKHPRFEALAEGERTQLQDFLRGADPNLTEAEMTAGDATSFYRLIAKEQSHYQASQWILRHTTTVSNRYTLNVSMANIEARHTFAQLPDDISEGIQAALDNLEAVAPAEIPEYEWSWLKQTPTITQTVANKVQVVEEWWLYYWPTVIYDPVS